jgi:hypothetical protein
MASERSDIGKVSVWALGHAVRRAPATDKHGTIIPIGEQELVEGEAAIVERMVAAPLRERHIREVLPLGY